MPGMSGLDLQEGEYCPYDCLIVLFGTRRHGLIALVLYAFPKPISPRGIRSMSATERQIPAPLELRSFVDAIPTMAWSALADGSLDFFNQRFRDYVLRISYPGWGGNRPFPATTFNSSG